MRGERGPARDRRWRDHQRPGHQPTAALSLMLTVALSTTGPAVAASRDRPDAASLQEGQQHFRRGLALYDEGDFDGAHAELERAFEIAPSYKILYDLGQISLRRQDWVAAERELRGYLAEGKGAVSPSRKREVNETLTRLAERVASLDITTDRPGARARIDDGPEMPLPLPARLRVNVGHHVVALTWPTGERETKSIDLVGGDQEALHFPATIARPEEPSPSASRDAWATRPPGGPLGLGLALPPLPSDENLAPSALLGNEGTIREATRSSPSRRREGIVWAGWTATAVFAAAAGATGALALRSSRSLAEDRTSYPIAPATLDREATQTRRYALAADALGAAAVALAGLSLFLTFHTD